jgi:hypothetical protein
MDVSPMNTAFLKAGGAASNGENSRIWIAELRAFRPPHQCKLKQVKMVVTNVLYLEFDQCNSLWGMAGKCYCC